MCWCAPYQTEQQNSVTGLETAVWISCEAQKEAVQYKAEQDQVVGDETLHTRTISGASSETKAHGSRAGATSPVVRALPDINTSHVQEGVPEVDGTCTHAQTDISHLTVHAVSCCCMPEVNGTCTHAQTHISHLRAHAVSCCCMACCAAHWHSVTCSSCW